MKILCVIRTSTLRQETESQKNDMSKFLVSEGFNLSDIEFYESPGASARSLNRKYLEMLEYIKQRCSTDIDTVAVWHLNRLGRKESKLIEMKEFFINNKIQLIVKNPHFILFDKDGNVNPAADMMFSIFAVTVKFETEEMMQKMKRGKEQNKKLGKYNGGKLPFCYTVDSDNYIVINEEEVPILTELYKMYIEGQSKLHIRDYFWSLGYQYSPQNILKLLNRREIYEPVVGQQIYDDFIKSKEKRLHEPQCKERKYNLAEQLVICPYCGNHFYAHANVYRCSNIATNRSKIRNTCPGNLSLTIHRIDCMLVEATWHWFDIYTHENGTQRLQQIDKQLKDLPLQIKAVEKKLNNIQKKIERYAVSYAEGLISRQTRDSKIAEIKSESISLSNQTTILQNRLEGLREEKNNIQKQIITSEMTSNVVDSMSKVELYNLVHQFISKMEIKMLSQRDRVYIIHSKYFDDVITYRSKGLGRGYRLYICNPNKPGNYDDIADITDNKRYNVKYTEVK